MNILILKLNSNIDKLEKEEDNTLLNIEFTRTLLDYDGISKDTLGLLDQIINEEKHSNVRYFYYRQLKRNLSA